MSQNDSNFIDNEKKYWGKIFVDINYAIDNVKPFITEKTLNNRKYFIKKSVLKNYIDLIDTTENNTNNKKSFFTLFLNTNKSNDILIKYKNDNKSSFTQLENCSKCACLNCIKDCNFSSCLGCRSNSFIKKCDKEKINITEYTNWILDLTNNDSGNESRYIVLGTLEDCQLDKYYIVLENISDSNNKLILYYYPSIKEDSYGEITDGEEFDFIVETFEKRDL